jgi:hypothetical protein
MTRRSAAVRARTGSRSFGTTGFTSDASGGRVRITFDTVSSGVFPANGFCPVNISYASVPSVKTSVRGSTALPVACSGERYARTPTASTGSE